MSESQYPKEKRLYFVDNFVCIICYDLLSGVILFFLFLLIFVGPPIPLPLCLEFPHLGYSQYLLYDSANNWKQASILFIDCLPFLTLKVKLLLSPIF